MEHLPDTNSEEQSAADSPAAKLPVTELPVAEQPAAEPSPYAKANLVLKDPDPYAFANRISRLTIVFAILGAIAAGPYLLGQFAYHQKYGQMKAEVEVATEGLGKLKPQLQDFVLASRLVAKRIGPSVVSIYRPSSRGSEGQGSGVIVDTAGYAVTNYHVIENAERLMVRLNDGRIGEATVIGADPATDLAVIKIDLPNLIAAEWGDSDDVQMGDLVWAIGSPFGLEQTITFGIVSSKSRSSADGFRTESVYQEFIQTDVAVNPGNSGGPLVGLDGTILGINTMILGRAYQGVSFSIPSTFAKEKYERLIKEGWIERGYLGVSPTRVPEVVRRRLSLSNKVGVYVSGVVEGGPGSTAGLRRGDVIMRWNDHDAEDPTRLSREIANTEIGSNAAIVVKRMVQGQPAEVTLAVQVGRSPFSVKVTRSK